MHINKEKLFGQYKNKPVIVLGATGFIGRWVAHYLTLAGANLLLPVRDVQRGREIAARYRLSGEIVFLDYTDFENLSEIISRFSPDILFNLAGYGVDKNEQSPEMAQRINAELLSVICQGLFRAGGDDWAGARVVHTGSALEYGVIRGNLAEDSTPQPTTLYGKTKLAGTAFLTDFCRKNNLKGVTARLFTVYGPGEHEGRLLPSLIQAAKSTETLPLTAGAQERDFIYVEDVAEGLLRLGICNPPPGAIFNLATGKLTPVRKFVEIAARILRIPPERLHFGALPTRQEEMKHNNVTIARLRQATGWQPGTSISEGIEKTVAFFSNNKSFSGKNL